MPDSDELIQDSELNKMVIKFTLMCPGISMSTLNPGLSLHGSMSFKEICNKLITNIGVPQYSEYASDIHVRQKMLGKPCNRKSPEFSGIFPTFVNPPPPWN